MGIAGVQRIVCAYEQLPLGDIDALSVDHHDLVPCLQRLGELEGAVLDQLRVEPAVRAKVDVLKENSEHLGRDRNAGMRGIDVDDNGRILRVNGPREADERELCKGEGHECEQE